MAEKTNKQTNKPEEAMRGAGPLLSPREEGQKAKDGTLGVGWGSEGRGENGRVVSLLSNCLACSGSLHQFLGILLEHTTSQSWLDKESGAGGRRKECKQELLEFTSSHYSSRVKLQAQAPVPREAGTKH